MGGEPILGIRENKQLVTDTWTALARDEVEAAPANMTGHVTWLVPGMDPRCCGLKNG